jgi:NAD-dependent SIR2 family protein deacetylase
MQEYLLVIDCENCGEQIKEKCVWLSEGLPEITPNAFTCESFKCRKCGKKTYTGDLDILSEDEI